MAICAIIPVIPMLVEVASIADKTIKTTAYADSLITAGKIIQLKNWRNTLCRLGQKFDYFQKVVNCKGKCNTTNSICF